MSVNLERWDVEDEQFWESTGKKVANRNLWISIPNLLCGFAVWRAASGRVGSDAGAGDVGSGGGGCVAAPTVSWLNEVGCGRGLLSGIDSNRAGHAAACFVRLRLFRVVELFGRSQR